MPLTIPEYTDGGATLTATVVLDRTAGYTRTPVTGSAVTRALTADETAMLNAAEAQQHGQLLEALATGQSAAITLLAPKTTVTFTWAPVVFPNTTYSIDTTPGGIAGMTLTWVKYADRATLTIDGAGLVALGSTSFTALAYMLT